MRLLCYNIFNCLAHNRAFAALVGVCRDLEIQTLLLNEFRDNADGEALSAELRAAGYVHRTAGRSAERPQANRNIVAVFSREPFEVRINSRDARLVAVRQRGLSLVAWHAAPTGVADVLADLVHVEAAIRGEDDLLLAGDFNSLAAFDQPHLGYRDGAQQQQRYYHEGKLSFHAMQRLIDHGLIDTNQTRPAHTVPTAVGGKAEQGWKLRIDYALARGAAAGAVSRILRGDPYDTLSDHYPLLVDLPC